MIKKKTSEKKNQSKTPGLFKRFFSFIKNLFPSLTEIKQSRNSWALSAISGIFYTLLFPKFNFNFLAWIALIPFLISIKDKNAKLSFWLGIFFGFIAFYGSLFWINHIRKYNFFAVFGIPFISVYIGSYYGIFAAGVSVFYKNYRRFAFLLSACLWVAVEYIRCSGTFAFPFNILAVSQVGSIKLIQICDVTGIYGISFIVVLVNLLLTDAVYSYRKNQFRSLAAEIGIVAGILVFVFVYGTLRLLPKYRQCDCKPLINIAVVQPSIPQEKKFKSYADPDENVRAVLQNEINNFEIDMADKITSSPLDLIIFPETGFISEIFEKDISLQDKLKKLSESKKADLLFGADRYVMLDKNGKETKDADKALGYGGYNSAWFWDKNKGLSEKIYSKIHLLPFGEYVPYFDKIPYFQELIVQVGSFIKGKEFTIFESGEQVYFGTGICIESVIPYIFREFRKKGAQFFVVITNDAWYENTAGPYQHAEFCVFRAVENRTWLARCANHGISGFISPFGEWHEKSKLNEEKIIRFTIGGEYFRNQSFYTRFGDVFAMLSLIISVLFIALRKFLR